MCHFSSKMANISAPGLFPTMKLGFPDSPDIALPEYEVRPA